MASTKNPLAKEAQCQRDLGFLSEASRLFDLAISEDPDNVLLVLEAAGNKTSQRLLGDAHAMLLAQRDRMQSMISTLDPLHIALFDTFMALSTCTMTAKFEEPLRRAVEHYTAYAKDKPVESFDKHVVSYTPFQGLRRFQLNRDQVIITSLYHNLLAMARIMSYQPGEALPSDSPAFHVALLRHLLSEKRYDDAIKVAKICDYSDESVDNVAMFQFILAEEDLPDLQRAEVLWEYGDKMRLVDGSSAWRDSLLTAADLFDRSGHVTGALDMRIDLVRYERDDNASINDDTAELWQIKAKMESVGNWASVNRCLTAIAEINYSVSVGEVTAATASLLAQVEEEWLRVTEICSESPAGEPASMIKLLEWSALKPRSANGLEYMERFYNRIKDCDAHAMIGLVLASLLEIYQAIGDNEKAIECLTRRPDALPRQLKLTLGVDPFETALRAATEAPDSDAELTRLLGELQDVQSIIRRSPTVAARTIEVQRLCNLCFMYIQQHTFRPVDQIELLVDCFDVAIEEGCRTLDAWQATVMRATSLQHKAYIPQLKSARATSMEELEAFTRETLQYYQEALDLYDASGHTQDWRAVTGKGYVANSHRMLWNLAQKPAVSDDFMTAARLYEEAAKGGTLKHQQLTCLNALRLWVEGHNAKVEVDPAVFQFSSPFDTALNWAKEADQLENVQRNDLSSLPRERAVLSKQLMSRQRDPSADFHMIALLLHDSVDDNVGAWNWLQRSKARSISDMLGLGINIPQSLKHLIETDPNLVSLCEVEQTMSQAIGSAPDDRQSLLRTKLEAHRAYMRQVPVLKQLLDYREGQPTSLERLQRIDTATPAAPDRKIHYVDYLIYNDHCIVFLASATGVDSFVTGVTGTEVAQWKAQYLHNTSAQCHPLDSSETEALQKLSKLVQGVVTRTAPKDIIVICPSGVLHGVPLHAATLSDDAEHPDSKKCLLERNPVVYTASMTTFEQCNANELNRGEHLLPSSTSDNNTIISRSYVAVYERTETAELTPNQTQERDAIYAKIREVAAKHQHHPTATTVSTGPDATRESLIASFKADHMYFFGHCESSSSNMLLQGLVLAGPSSPRLFTASDIFGIDVQTSCVTLLACGSADQTYTPQGDEPLGIVSALLCAGATSVIGTMWKVQVSTAGLLTDILDGKLNKKDGRKDELVDLAVAVQESALRLKKRRGEGATDRPYHWAAFVLHGSWFMAPRRGGALDLGSLSLTQ